LKIGFIIPLIGLEERKLYKKQKSVVRIQNKISPQRRRERREKDKATG
jgi:hypothetical protein